MYTQALNTTETPDPVRDEARDLLFMDLGAPPETDSRSAL